MKSTVFLLSVLFLFSCSNDEGDETQGLQGKWRLVRITSVWTNTTLEGPNLGRQEFYVFREDSTFMKSRQLDGEETEANGVYSKGVYADGQEYFSLTFGDNIDMAGSCSKDKEELQLVGAQLSNNSWAHCDGPILEYVKVD